MGRIVIVILGGGTLLLMIYAAVSVLVWGIGAEGTPDLRPLSTGHLLGTDPSGRDWLRALAIAGLADAATVVLAVTFCLSLACLLGCLAGAGWRFLEPILRCVGTGSVLLLVIVGLAVIDAHGLRPTEPSGMSTVMVLLLGLAAVGEPAFRIAQVTAAERVTPHYRGAVELGFSPLACFLRHALPAIGLELRVAMYRATVSIAVALLTLRFLMPEGGAASLGNLIAFEASRFDPDRWWNLANPVAVTVLGLMALCLLAEGRRR
ncbi:MAG: hypothetical protein AAGH74_12805 [Pseudomonadota bacterium]